MSLCGKGIAACAIAALVLLPPSALEREQVQIDPYKLGDIPLHIMPVDEVAAILSQHSYQTCSDTQRPVWDNHLHMMERGETENVRYMFRESLRTATIIDEAFNSPAHLELARVMMDDDEKNRVWMEIRGRQRECEARMRERGDLSPEIGDILEYNIRELERVGIDKWMLSCYETAADYFFAVQEDEKAIGYLSRAYDNAIATRYHTQVAHLGGRVGKYNERTGDFAAAEEAYERCLESARVTRDGQAIARALSFMASLERKRGRYVEAEDLYRQSLEYCGEVENPECEISILQNIAELHYSFGYIDRAAYLTQSVILLGERALEEPTVARSALKRHLVKFSLSNALSLLARLQHRNGETERALRTIERALSTAEDFADKYYYSGLEKLAGDLHLSNGDFQKASRHYDRALKIIRRLGNRGREAEYLVAAADLRIQQGRLGEAEEMLGEAERAARDEGLWRIMLETEFLRGESAAERGRPGEAITHYERAVAVFDETCPRISYEENKHDVAEEMQLLYSRILDLQRTRAGESDSLLFWAEKSSHRPCGGVSKSHNGLEQMIRKCITDRTWVPESSFVIRYVVTENHIIGIGMDSNGCAHHSTAVHIEDLKEEIGRFFTLCNPDETAYIPGRPHIEELSGKLYRLLVEPFSASLGGKETLCIIAPDPLDRLPFAAILTPEGDFLCERLRIVIAPSLLHLYRAGDRRSSPGESGTFSTPLLVGPPKMTPGIRRLFPDLRDLPHAADEIDRIARLLGGGVRLTGAEATPESLLALMEHSDLIHIAGHTVHFPIYSGEKAFILSTAGDDSSHVESSLLFEASIRGLDLRSTRLVVLSSCETLPGAEASTGHGPGLAGAFFKAGAGSVIATIWPIEDRDASTLMASVYGELIGTGSDAIGAVAGIQRRMIEEDRESGNSMQRIRMWAPYVVLSSLGPVPPAAHE